jgi:hypothetical protein
MGTLVDNGGCYFNGEIILPAPEVMVMNDELAELRAFKATTTPAATTGAAHLGKRARVQQDRLPEIALFRGAARCFCYFQFRGEGETVRELSVSNRAGQEIFINAMSVARSKHHECCEKYLHKHHACMNAGIVSIKSSCTGDLHKHHECCEIALNCGDESS